MPIFVVFIVAIFIKSTQGDDDVGLLIENHFNMKTISGLYCFYCQQDIFHNSIGVLSSYRIIHITSSDEQKLQRDCDIIWSISHTGVYLDLTCLEGINFLRQCSKSRILFGNNYRWLMKSKSYDESISILNNLKISIDSDITLALSIYNQYDLYEVYKVHESTQVLSYHVGKIDKNRIYSETGVKPNRDNLMGFVMNVTFNLLEIELKENETLFNLLDDSFYSESARFYRFSFPLFLHLNDISNFTYRFTITKGWGVEESPGNWTGLVGILQREECEFGLIFSKCRKDRLDVIEIHHTYKIAKTLFVFLQPPAFGSYKALTKPFTFKVWIASGAICLFLIIAYIFLAKYDKETFSFESWSSMIVYVTSAVAQQGLFDSVENGLSSTKLTSLLLLLFTFLLCFYYNAAVLNGLLSRSTTTITTLDQLVDSSLELGVLDLPYMHDFDSEESLFGHHDEPTKRMFNKLLRNNKIFYKLDEALSKVRKGHFALFIDDGVLFPLMRKMFTQSEICSSYIILKNTFHTGITLKKNSPYKELLSRKLQIMREVGLLKRNLELWYPAPQCIWTLNAVPIGLQSVTIAFIVLLAGYAVSFIVLLFRITIKIDITKIFKIIGKFVRKICTSGTIDTGR